MSGREFAKEFCWDAAAIATLKELVSLDMSGDKIAARLGGGLSRPAVLGKIYRLGLSKSKAVDWTPQLVETLKACADEGLSLAQTAGKMGLTRNTVLGKASRLKIKFRNGTGSRPRGFGIPAKAPAKPRVSIAGNGMTFEPAPAAAMPKLRIVEATGEPARIIDPHFGGCKWPINDPGAGRMDQTLFCCGPRDPTKPYCEAHLKLAWNGLPKKPKAASTPSVGSARGPGGHRYAFGGGVQ